MGQRLSGVPYCELLEFTIGLLRRLQVCIVQLTCYSDIANIDENVFGMENAFDFNTVDVTSFQITVACYFTVLGVVFAVFVGKNQRNPNNDLRLF